MRPGRTRCERLAASRDEALDPECRRLLADWPGIVEAYCGDERVSSVRGREIRTALHRTSPSGLPIPKVALPRFSDDGDLLSWLRREHLPGHFPYTAGVFEFKRAGEDPTRMFAGEGDAFRTNRRFRALSKHSAAKRLSTAFDSVTLYGQDPATRPDIHGKIGNAGVSIATVEDMEALYDGFDLVDPATSVSMTINGPAPTVLAFFFLTAIRQQLRKFETDEGRPPDEAERAQHPRAHRRRGARHRAGRHPEGGPGPEHVPVLDRVQPEADGRRAAVVHRARGAELLLGVDLGLSHRRGRGEPDHAAGADPVERLHLRRELPRARHGRGRLRAEPVVLLLERDGSRVHRARARRQAHLERRDAGSATAPDERSSKLKYHVQTSGRSLHAQEMDFNDIRTTLQALIAVYDHCNSLHTNAFDEAVTTPTDASVRRAMAIQLIINREWGLAACENPNQGSFVIDELTSLVEEAVLGEFERISERGGVLGAMETGYQRGKIQDESMRYERAKHDGSLPIVGGQHVPARDRPGRERGGARDRARPLERGGEGEPDRAPGGLPRPPRGGCARGARGRPAHRDGGRQRVRRAVAGRRGLLARPADRALFEVGGQYRRNM